MRVYLIVDVRKIRVKKKYAEYVRKVPETIRRFGGRYLARGSETQVVSGKWKPGRLVIVEFPSMKRFREWWDSAQYRKIKPLRERSARTNAVVAAGM